MCGIAGILSRRGRCEPRAVSQMLSAMRHRGPDGTGTFHDAGLGLGHCRLAVLDPSPAGAQPMFDASGRYVCVFNGALYNFCEIRRELERMGRTFRSAGDTEVLVEGYAAWGPSLLDRLNGMFAFAIYDRRSRELFCARDRLGVKPFVYVSDAQKFAFASEHKALIMAGLADTTPSPDGVYEFLAQGHVSAGGSLFTHIRSLPPGHLIHIDAQGRETLRRWWQPGSEPQDDMTEPEVADLVRCLVTDATRLRLRSDVPLGAHLSGGLDSSAVTAAAVRSGARELATFTGAFAAERAADERRWSRMVAGDNGLRLVEIELDIDALADVFRRVVWHLDEPVVGPGVLPQQLVYDASARHGIKVILSGHGGDELFGGYLRHRGAYYKRVFSTDPDPRRRAAAAIELTRLAAAGRRRLMRQQTVPDTHLAADFLRSVDPAVRQQARRGAATFGTAAELMCWDLQHYLPGLLHAEDRISMASSIESRAPLLDYRLVEVAVRLPERSHFRPCTTKPVLRDAVTPWLPRPVADRRDKRGFPTPLGHWSRHPRMCRLVRELVHSASPDLTVFAPEFLARPEVMSAGQLWSVMQLQAWLTSATGGTP